MLLVTITLNEIGREYFMELHSIREKVGEFETISFTLNVFWTNLKLLSHNF